MDSTIDNRWLTPMRWLTDSPTTYEMITPELQAAYEYPDYPYDPADKTGPGRVADLFLPYIGDVFARLWTNDKESFGYVSAYPEKMEFDPRLQTYVILKMRMMNHNQVPVSKAFDSIVSEFGRGSLKVSDLSKIGG